MECLALGFRFGRLTYIFFYLKPQVEKTNVLEVVI